jgi:membrane protein YdbS with pleckstrin-like domain
MENLLQDETIVFESKKHWFAPVRASAWAAVMILGAFLIGWISPDSGPGFFGAIGKLLDLLRIGLFLYGIGWIVYNVVAWRTARFAVTSLRVLRDEGLISHRTSTTLLRSITDVKTHTGPIGRVLGFGDLIILTQSGDSGADRLLAITHPLEFRQAIMTRQMGDRGASAAAAPGAGAPIRAAPDASAAPATATATDAADALARLADLRDRGAITPEEYDAKKAELLARM